LFLSLPEIRCALAQLAVDRLRCNSVIVAGIDISQATVAKDGHHGCYTDVW